MPTVALVPNAAAVSNTGWTNATAANLSTVDTTYGTCTAAGSVYVIPITDAPADYGTSPTVVLRTTWKLSGTASRTKNLLIELISDEATPTVYASYATPAVTSQASDTLHSSGAIAVTITKAQLTAARLRVTMQEGGGMADTVTVQQNRVAVDLTYTALSNDRSGTALVSGKGNVTATGNKVAPPAAVTDLTATAISSGRIDLAWTKSPTATGYRIQRRKL